MRRDTANEVPPAGSKNGLQFQGIRPDQPGSIARTQQSAHAPLPGPPTGYLTTGRKYPKYLKLLCGAGRVGAVGPSMSGFFCVPPARFGPGPRPALRRAGPFPPMSLPARKQEFVAGAPQLSMGFWGCVLSWSHKPTLGSPWLRLFYDDSLRHVSISPLLWSHGCTGGPKPLA